MQRRQAQRGRLTVVESPTKAGQQRGTALISTAAAIELREGGDSRLRANAGILCIEWEIRLISNTVDKMSAKSKVTKTKTALKQEVQVTNNLSDLPVIKVSVIDDSMPMCHSNTQDEDSMPMCLSNKHHDESMPMCLTMCPSNS